MSVLPPFKCIAYSSPGVRADLQYIGHCQNNADWVNSGCFYANGIAFLKCTNPPTGTLVWDGDDTVTGYNIVNGNEIHFVGTGRVWNLRDDVSHWPLSER